MTDSPDLLDPSFLGIGWSFPPAFEGEGKGVVMVRDEEDIDQSLRILFGTMLGERLFHPTYGLDMQTVLFEPMSTTMRALLTERVKTTTLLFEPRIDVLALDIGNPDPSDGVLHISLTYRVRATNSRFNLVFPFYQTTDSNEARGLVGLPKP